MKQDTWGLKFTGVGTALPDKVLSNQDLTAWMDTSDEWIRERTGIHERRIGGTTSGLAIEAGQDAITKAGVSPDEFDHLILATTTPDKQCPATSTTVTQELGMSCGSFDLQAVCSGWVYGLVVANGLLLQGMDRILLIGSDTMENLVDFHDRSVGILFGNGAGAVVIERDKSGAGELLAWDLGADGSLSHILYADHGDTFKMDGREVFRQAVTAITKSTTATLERAGVSPDKVNVVVPHQANIRIIEAAWKKLGFSIENTAVVLDRTGNTSAASIPLALEDSLTKGDVNKGDLVLFVGFGAGMAWGSALVRWN